MQNHSGGVALRIKRLSDALNCIPDVSVSLYNKWTDKLSDFDILSYFKLSVEGYETISYAKNQNKKIVVASVVPQINKFHIQFGRSLNKIFPIQNTYSFQNKILNIADVIIAQTRKEALFLHDAYGIANKKIRIIPNGVSESFFEASNRAKKRDKVLYIGRFDHNKNQLSLIKALKNTSIECHFIGGSAIEDRDYYNQCRNEAKSSNNIFFHGWLNNSSKEFIDLLSEAKVVALLSKNEIFGNALIEGAAAGANLVITRALPIEELGLGGSCEVVNDVFDIKEIRGKIIKAFGSETNNQLSEFVHSKYSWQSVAQEYFKVYNSLVD
ncbi:glycosyltransferase family 4 protein [Porphyromonas levii]|uniref:glycosyltransferase family 4 protein n=1 Tax=Porphyromonas levii TaxID=28114 RepID=UPI00201350B8|nr:glycosyltransferase family 4 protein [Porphyromonas levii]